ncbi:hypothetical protein NE235_37040 [Actinoallomurus spadix]|uniref:Tat pathway signal sequence domain protein n=1 Tax=Actinoallomurus spadix TaxID=79912 RepID=A0ABP3H4V4_9ACTN|nr:hypothetical protein [Actinoallomurus spadix]MCO5991729.1 hypothetical protein [Actinoallomurus spadix]
MKLPVRVLAVGGLAAVLVSTAGLSAADASTTDSTVTLTATRAAGPSLRADVITCKVTAHNPHYSHHAHAKNRDIVNVTADIKCSKKVASISIQVALYKNNTLYKKSAVKRNAGKNYISQNAARRCVKKQHYTGVAVGTVNFPPGYTPPSKSGRGQSKTVYIAACKKK